ncbi:glycosyltransferase family 4 protein [Sharpea azabuensis]|uniref:glycosyltransferase family 4 protein n=1 Tax=Sharpea azabuensis TaxID=322505 RepID=UPI0013DB9E63|nr:glycosyltransferase family 4 protein [Sharpea azabuensis]
MKKSNDVIFLCQYFYPEYNSSATLPWDTAQYLASHGLKVASLCGYPKEYVHEKKISNEEVIKNVNIKRVHYIQLKRSKKIGRLIDFLSFMISILIHLKEIGKSKMVIVYSNPPILPLAAVLAKKIYKTKVVFVSYDVYPDVAFASNSISRNGKIAAAMNHINKKVFYYSDSVVALTEEMKGYLIGHRKQLKKDRVYVIPNWACEKKTQRKGLWFKKFGFPEGAFIVSYFGNLGVCQDIDTFLQAINLLKNSDDIYFLIAGHGSKKEKFSKEVEKFPNVKVFDYLTGSDFEEALSISSCGVVSLEPGLRGMCAPSKYYSYLQCGCAVVGIVEKESYLSEEIKEKNIGFTVSNGESALLAQKIKNLKNDTKCLKEMSDNSSSLYQSVYSKQMAMHKYEKLVKALI